jgi:hypothetical protein
VTYASQIKETANGGGRRVVSQAWTAEQVVAERRLSRYVRVHEQEETPGDCLNQTEKPPEENEQVMNKAVIT